MFEKPYLKKTSYGFVILIAPACARPLLEDLIKRGHEATLAPEEIGHEDLNKDNGHEDVGFIELPSSVDVSKLRKFLRGWTR